MQTRRNSDGADSGSDQQAAGDQQSPPTDREMLSRFETLEQQVAQMPQVVAAAVSAAMRQHSQQATAPAASETRRVQFAEQQIAPQHAALQHASQQSATQLFADGDDELLAELAATGLASAYVKAVADSALRCAGLSLCCVCGSSAASTSAVQLE